MSVEKRIPKRSIKKPKMDNFTADSVITKWSSKEAEKYLECIREHGHKDVEKLKEIFPNKSLEAIKGFLRTAFDVSIRVEEGHPNLNGWLEHCKSKVNSPWKDCIQIAQVMKYLSVDGLLENHPLPSQSEGINFPDAYRLVYQALMGYPLQPVSEKTADFVLSTLTELAGEIKKETIPAKNLTDFLKSGVLSSDNNNDVTSEQNETQSDKKVKKPIRVYQRKKQKLSSEANVAPTLEITVTANEAATSTCGTKDYSLIISNKNNEKNPFVINVPVPVRLDSLDSMDENEKNIIKSETYNPLKIPEKWLQEPVFINLLVTNHKR